MPLNDNACTLGLLGAKGGVGTTVLATSLAWALAQRGQRVVMLDLDQTAGQAALHLCERNAGPTLRDALQVIDRLDATLLDTLLTPCTTNLRLLPAPRAWVPPEAEPSRDGAALQRLVEVACELADCVLLDLPAAAMADEACAPLLRHIDEVVLVSEPTLPATYNARRAWQWLQDERHDVHHQPMARCSLVLNKVQRQHTITPAQVWRTLGLDGEEAVRRELPRSDAAVAQATYQGQALGALDTRDSLARALAQWADERTAAWHAARAAFADEGEQEPAATDPWTTWRARLQRWAA